MSRRRAVVLVVAAKERVGWAGEDRVIRRGATLQAEVAPHEERVVRPDLRRAAIGDHREQRIVVGGVLPYGQIDLPQVIQAACTFGVGVDLVKRWQKQSSKDSNDSDNY